MTNKIMNMKLLVIFILNIPLLLFGQHSIRGIVLDSNHKPVPFVTVYINGTSNGTFTDTTGVFVLKEVDLPAQLITSCTGYYPAQMNIEDNTQNDIKISLKTRITEIPQVDIIANLRGQDMLEFKRWFIGSDNWGVKSKLKNDSVLKFNRVYDSQRHIVDENSQRVLKAIKRYDATNFQTPQNDNVTIKNSQSKSIFDYSNRIWDKDSSLITTRSLSSFKATASAPLIIDKPILGYTLTVDLLSFEVGRMDNNLQCNTLGYYFFKPYNTKSKRKAAKYARNREAAYYNSDLHFCRSLYNNKLKENGYRILENKKNDLKKISIGQSVNMDSIKIPIAQPVNIDSLLRPVNNNQLKIIGLNKRWFTILYYSDKNGKPIDLNVQKGSNYIQSSIYFLNDTCIIRSDGTIPDTNIMFGGAISEKKNGASLPSDYHIDQFIKEKNSKIALPKQD
jgi:hypothetical protein